MLATHTFRRGTAGLAVLAALSLSLTACGDDDTPERVDAIATVEDLSGGRTTSVTLDQGFVDALESLGLTPSAVGTGELSDGALIFPITGGNVSLFEPGTVPNYVVGQVQHEGSGFRLEAGGTQVDIGNFNVDPGISKVYGDVNVNGAPAAVNVVIFDLNGNTLNPADFGEGTVTLQGTQVLLSDTAAGLLNDVFSTDAVTGGLLIGIAEITVATG